MKTRKTLLDAQSWVRQMNELQSITLVVTGPNSRRSLRSKCGKECFTLFSFQSLDARATMKASAQCAFAFWLFLSLLVSYGTATGSEQSTASLSDGATEFRIRSQNLHADYLENELDKLERELKDLSEPSAEDVARVKARIKRLES